MGKVTLSESEIEALLKLLEDAPNREELFPIGVKIEAARPKPVPESETVSVPEAGRILGIGRNSAYALARSGELPVIHLGKRVMVSKRALENLLGGNGR